MISTMSASSRTRSTISSVSSELGDGDSGASLVPGAKTELLHSRVLLQHFVDALAKRARSLPVNDTQGAQIGTNRGVQRLHHDPLRLVSAHSADVDLARGRRIGEISRPRHGDVRWRRIAGCQRREGYGHLDCTNGYHRAALTQLDDASRFASEGRNVDPTSGDDLTSGPSRRRRASAIALREIRFFTLETI